MSNTFNSGWSGGDIYGATSTGGTVRPIDIEVWRIPPSTQGSGSAASHNAFANRAIDLGGTANKGSPIVIDMDSDSERDDVQMANASEPSPSQTPTKHHRLAHQGSPTAARPGRKAVTKYEAVTSLKTSPSPGKGHRRAKIDAASKFVATPEIRYDICQEILETIGPNRFDWTKVAEKHGVEAKKIAKVRLGDSCFGAGLS